MESVTSSASSAPTVVVVGNEKGGTGKSTTTVHLAIALLRRGYRVATLDLDPRQKTLTRYFENRRSHAAQTGEQIATPDHFTTDPLEGADVSAIVVARARLAAARRKAANFDFLIIDTPGSASALSRAGHEIANILITPVNDSLVDIDVLARIDFANRTVLEPSVYARFVVSCREGRTGVNSPPLSWIVIRNRLLHLDSRNKREVTRLLELLGPRLGFRFLEGLSERVVFRELFAQGLTVFDLAEKSGAAKISASRQAGRSELDALLEAIGVRQLETLGEG
jgi:chromosome partitioning protein